MDKPDSKQWPVMVGLLIAVVGVISPILWDVFRSNAAVELKQTGQTTLIQRSDRLEKLKVEYDGQVVKELSSVRFTFANTGSKPIRDSDLIAPPTITFLNVQPVLDARIESVFPANLVATIVRLTNSSAVSLSFPLLNPGDNLQFVVLLANSSPVTFRADARIVGVSKLKVEKQPELPARAERQISWAVYAVGAFTFLSILAVWVGIKDIPKEQQFKKLMRENKFNVPANLTKELALSFVQLHLGWTTPKERRVIYNFFESLKPQTILSSESTDRLEHLMRDCCTVAASNVAMVVLFSMIATTGLVYVLVHIF